MKQLGDESWVLVYRRAAPPPARFCQSRFAPWRPHPLIASKQKAGMAGEGRAALENDMTLRDGTAADLLLRLQYHDELGDAQRVHCHCQRTGMPRTTQASRPMRLAVLFWVTAGPRASRPVRAGNREPKDSCPTQLSRCSPTFPGERRVLGREGRRRPCVFPLSIPRLPFSVLSKCQWQWSLRKEVRHPL